MPANTTQATQKLDVAMFRGFKGDVRDDLAARVIAMDVPNNKSKKITVWEVMECASRAYERAFISSKIEANFLETGVEPWDPEKLERHVTRSDSMARVRKPAESLARLAVRLAQAVAKERNDLKWERGTMRTTQSVFMDACNRQWLAQAELAKEKETQDKAEKTAARDAAHQKKKVADAEKAKEVVARRAAMKKKKEDEASKAEQRAVEKAARQKAAAARAAAEATRITRNKAAAAVKRAEKAAEQAEKAAVRQAVAVAREVVAGHGVGKKRRYNPGAPAAAKKSKANGTDGE